MFILGYPLLSVPVHTQHGSSMTRILSMNLAVVLSSTSCSVRQGKKDLSPHRERGEILMTEMILRALAWPLPLEAVLPVAAERVAPGHELGGHRRRWHLPRPATQSSQRNSEQSELARTPIVEGL